MKTHLFHLIVLILILGGGVISFVILKGDAQAQLGIGVATGVAYVIWGVLHHAIQRDLHPKVVIEYVLFGAVAVLVLMMALRR